MAVRLDIRHVLACLAAETLGSRRSLSALVLLEAYGERHRREGVVRVALDSLPPVPARRHGVEVLVGCGLFRAAGPDAGPDEDRDGHERADGRWIEIREEFLPDLGDVRSRASRYLKAALVFHECSPAPPDDLARALLKGAVLFNQRLFFEVHEVLEAQWKRETSDSKAALQGLIQAAVAFHHLENQNYRGAVSLLDQALRRLRPCHAGMLGLNLGDFAAGLARCRETLGGAASRQGGGFSWGMVPRLLWSGAG